MKPAAKIRLDAYVKQYAKAATEACARAADLSAEGRLTAISETIQAVRREADSLTEGMAYALFRLIEAGINGQPIEFEEPSEVELLDVLKRVYPAGTHPVWYWVTQSAAA